MFTIQKRLTGPFFGLAAALLTALPALAEEEAAGPDPGSTAWMLTATALVLFMTIPGLSLFYGGLVRSKNVLSVLMQCFSIVAMMSLIWVIIGYSLAFDVPESQSAEVTNLATFVGGLGHLFLAGVTSDTVSGDIPLTVFIMFQMTFFIITPALICGAFAERMKFSAVVIFTTLWSLLVYAPICHMAWSGEGALFHNWGVLDFAGGTVVHINAGIAALVGCIMVGKRQGWPERPIPPHNLTLTVMGAGMLWVGWFGFNAGSQLAADGVAGMAMLVTQISTAAATLTWIALEWILHKRPSVLGAVTGAVAGLVAITPASGTCGPMGAIAIGCASSVACYIVATKLKHKLGFDDSLDAFGVHGVGGIVGALLTGVFAAESLGGAGISHDSIATQVMYQGASILVTIVVSGVGSIVLFKLIDLTIGLRVDAESESMGLDLAEHGEDGYIISAGRG